MTSDSGAVGRTLRINDLPVLPTGGSMGDIFSSFYWVKNNKIANNPTTNEAREKLNTHLESSEFFDVCSTELKTNKILLNKIRHQLLVTTKQGSNPEATGLRS